jgi:hypothetical protein
MATTDPSRPTTDYPPPAPTTAGGRGFTIAAFVCAAVAVLFIPIILGPAGMVLGYMGHRRGDPLGRWAIGAALVGMVAGFILGAILFSASSGGS